jgi:mycothiol synthase
LGDLGFATGSRYRVTLADVDADADLDVVALSELNDTDRAALVALLDRSAAPDGHPALPEPQLTAVTRPGAVRSDGRIVLARHQAGLEGFAVLSPARDGSTVVHLVVDPGTQDRAERIASVLIGRAVAESPPGTPIHLWALEAQEADEARAREHGFVPERDLLQMRVPLPLAPDVVQATRPVVTRPFVPGQDDDAWVDTNNRAFADHPEQGGWTVDQLRERLASDWVELDGFLVADDPDGAGLIGSCWTKIHRDRSPVLGEIYVISVDPRHHGHGWGRSLTVAGLEWLAHRSVPVGMLYTDATNEAAVALYRSLGFTVDHVDRSYRRDPA